jgi:hypothetical protein
MTVINPDELPCNCRQCHACAILGIAYPLPVPAPAPTALAEPEPTKPERKPVPTLFDGVPA